MNKTKILIGTTNPTKIKGAKDAFLEYYKDIEINGIKVSSDVSDEPVNEDIYNGAKNRVENLINYAKENKINADYYLGIESGITNKLGKWIIISIAVIKDKNGFESWGTSSGFPVPEKYVHEIITKDLGIVMDHILKTKDIGKREGGVGALTHNVIKRTDLTHDAFVMALTMYQNNYWN